MANRDHSLDDRIICAARAEFLSCGFRKASLHKIADNAGVTTGAIYTRYRNKDALFSSLLQDFLSRIDEVFEPVVQEYEKARRNGTADALLYAIDFEEHTYSRLLHEYYDDCTLFFCRSDGSSVETLLNGLMDRKVEQTVEFFSQTYGKTPNADALRLLMGSQFWYFRQLLDAHLPEDDMAACLKVILDFTNAGWRQFCNDLS